MTARCHAVVWCLVLCAWPGEMAARAEPAIVARMDRQEKGRSLVGDLRFDLSGGVVRGQAKLVTPTHPDSPLRRTDGSKVPGRFEVQIDLDGTYPGGSFGAISGSVTLSGTFTPEAGGRADLRGTGKFKGTVSGPSGLAEVNCTWERVTLDGGGMDSPQPFVTQLNFAFKPTNTVPVLRKEEPAAELAAGSMAISSKWIVAIGLAVVFCIIAVMIIKWKKRRQPRSTQGFRLRLSTGQTVSLPDGKRLTGADLPGHGHAAASMVAEVARNPKNLTVLGLKNLTARAWTATLSTGAKRQIGTGRSIQLAFGTRINFGGVEGEIVQDGSASAAPTSRK